MKRFFECFLPFLLAVGVIHADTQTAASGANMSTNATYTGITPIALKNMYGELYQIEIDVVAVTCGVRVAVQSVKTTMAEQTIFESTNITADVVHRVRLDSSSSAGAALTGDPPEAYWLDAGDVVNVYFYAALATNKSANVTIKTTR